METNSPETRKRIVVTGGNGLLGTEVIKQLLDDQDVEVVNVDKAENGKHNTIYRQANLNDPKEALRVMEGADAIIHLAAIPAPITNQPEVVLSNNAITTYNVLEAAYQLNIKHVVTISSESIYGFAWAIKEFSPIYLPIDEQHPLLPQESYGLSKIVNEETAAMFSRLDNSMHIFCLRFPLIVKPERYGELLAQPPASLKRNLWSYIDIRDAAATCIICSKTDCDGYEILGVSADEVLSRHETKELIEKYYPDVRDIRQEIAGRQALMSNTKAKQILDWQPNYSKEAFC